MSNTFDNVKDKFGLHSGEPGSTGREVFEDSTATGPGAAYSDNNTSGQGEGVMSSTTAPPGAGTGAGHHGTHGGAQGVGSQVQGDSALTGTGAGQGIVGGTSQPHEHHSHENDGHIGGQRAQTQAQAPTSQASQPHSGVDEATAGSGTTAHSGGGGGVHTFGTGHGDGTDREGPLPDAKDGHLWPVGDGLPAGVSGNRVGNKGQGQALYERTTDQGPVTGGAAGTDRFDTDKPTSGAATGASGVNTGVAGFGGSRENDITERAHDKSSGNVGGVLGTSDKDFTGRDRLGQGAYENDHQTDAPGGQSALTGREGNFSENPVSDRDNVGPGGAGVSTTQATGNPTTGQDEVAANAKGVEGSPANPPSSEAHKATMVDKLKAMLP